MHWVFRKVSRSSTRCLPSAIEKAQKKIEGNNFGIRKNLLEYDQVMNEQREIIYKERRRVLDGENMRDAIFKMITDHRGKLLWIPVFLLMIQKRRVGSE